MSFTTRATLLERLGQGDEVAWADLCRLYTPLIRLRAGDRGLRDAEKDDVIQEVLLTLFRGNKTFRYDRCKGRFRDYLKKIVDCRAFDILRKRRPDEKNWDTLEREGALLSSTDHARMEAAWDQAWQEHILGEALRGVRPEVSETTYQAFEMVMIDAADPQLVADTLGISVASVYMAKHRVLSRVRSLVRSLENDL